MDSRFDRFVHWFFSFQFGRFACRPRSLDRLAAQPEIQRSAQSESRKKMDNPFDCLSDDYQTRVEEKAAAEAIMATKVRLQVQF